nr:MAG TPA: hypothetical protein [Crassvirales sp.]
MNPCPNSPQYKDYTCLPLYYAVGSLLGLTELSTSSTTCIHLCKKSCLVTILFPSQ